MSGIFIPQVFSAFAAVFLSDQSNARQRCPLSFRPSRSSMPARHSGSSRISWPSHSFSPSAEVSSSPTVWTRQGTKEMYESTAFSRLARIIASVREFGSLSADEFEASILYKAYFAYCEQLMDKHNEVGSPLRNMLLNTKEVAAKHERINSHWDMTYGSNSLPKYRKFLFKLHTSLEGEVSGSFGFQFCLQIRKSLVLAKKFDGLCALFFAAERKDDAGTTSREVLRNAVWCIYLATTADVKAPGLAGDAARDLLQNVLTSGQYTADAIWTYVRHVNVAMFGSSKDTVLKATNEAIEAVLGFVKWFMINVNLPIVAFTDDNRDESKLLGQPQTSLKSSFCYWLYDARTEFQTLEFQTALQGIDEDSLSRGGSVRSSLSVTHADVSSKLSQLLQARPRLAATLALEQALHIVRSISTGSSRPFGWSKFDRKAGKQTYSIEQLVKERKLLNLEARFFDRKDGESRIRLEDQFFKTELVRLEAGWNNGILGKDTLWWRDRYFFLAQRVMFFSTAELLDTLGGEKVTCERLTDHEGVQGDAGRPMECRMDGAFLPAWKHDSWSYCTSGLRWVFDFQSGSDGFLSSKGGYVFLSVVESGAMSSSRLSTDAVAHSGVAATGKDPCRHGIKGQDRRTEMDWNGSLGGKDEGWRRAEGDDETYRRLLLRDFFGSRNALFTPVSDLASHKQETEMIVAPGNVYEILSIFTFPRNMFSSGFSVQDLFLGRQGWTKEQKGEYLDQFFKRVDARLTELFLDSPGGHDIRWTRHLAESMKDTGNGRCNAASRLNGIAIVKIRNPYAASLHQH